MELDKKELKVISDIMEQVNQYGKNKGIYFNSIDEFLTCNQKYYKDINSYFNVIESTLVMLSTPKDISATTYFRIKDNHIDTLEFGTINGKLVEVDLPESVLELEHLDKVVYHCKKPSPLLAKLKIKKLEVSNYDRDIIKKKSSEALTEYINETLSDITKIKSLEELTLRGMGNQVRVRLPNELSNLTNLKKLTIDFCLLNELPPVIKNLTNLRELILETTWITKLPSFINEMLNLEYLDVSGPGLDYDSFNSISNERLEKLKIKMHVNEQNLITLNEEHYLLNKDLMIYNNSSPFREKDYQHPIRIDDKRELVKKYFSIKASDDETLNGLLLRGLIKTEQRGTNFIKLMFPEFIGFMKEEIKTTNSEAYKMILANLTQNF